MRYIPAALATIFFAVGLLTLSDYGITWDSPHRFMRGQAYVEYFLTGKRTFGQPQRLSPNIITPGTYMTRFDFLSGEEDEPVELPERPLPQTEFAKLNLLGSYYKSDWWNGEYFTIVRPAEFGHLPLPEILGAFSNRLFFETLHFLPDIESYHIPYLAISALGVYIVSIFVFGITRSWFAAIVSGLVLATYPLFVAESRFNPKDPLVAVFFLGSIWSLWRWVSENKLRWYMLLILNISLSLAVKWNILFFPIIAFLWLLFIRKSRAFKDWFNTKKLLILSLIGLCFILAFLYWLWPMAWDDPLATLIGVIHYYLTIGAGTESIQPQGFYLPFGFNSYPILLLFAQTPEVVIVLTGIGIIAAARSFVGKELGVGKLVLLWLIIPIVRYSIPGVRVYSGYRQIIEVLPAVAVLCGFGIAYLIQRLKDFQKRIVIVTLILFALVIVDLVKIHPNQNAYFNRLVGGVRGAYQRNLIDFFLTHGNIYRQAASWLNNNAEPNSNIAILDGRMAALSSLWLRQDLSISPYHFTGFDKGGEYILMLESKINKPVFSYEYPRIFLEPVGRISVDGQTILSIYKNEARFERDGLRSETLLTDFNSQKRHSPSGDYLEIDLGRDAKVSRIILENIPVGCQSANSSAFVDEVISFEPDHTYGLMEKAVKDARVEYYFPAEPARFIRIYPKSNLSCFSGGKIGAIAVVP